MDFQDISSQSDPDSRWIFNESLSVLDDLKFLKWKGIFGENAQLVNFWNIGIVDIGNFYD